MPHSLKKSSLHVAIFATYFLNFFGGSPAIMSRGAWRPSLGQRASAT